MIKINDRFCIAADERQYILQERKVRKDGKDAGEEYVRSVGYYTTVSDALTGACRALQRERVANCDMSMQESIQAFRDVERCVMEGENVHSKV